MDRQGLLDFICEMFNMEECPMMILRQIHKYITERRYDYLDIARALSFYVDIEGQTMDIKKYGIGIVPFVMDEAKRYFRKLEEQKKQQIEAAERAKKLKEQKEQGYIVVKVTKKRTIKKPSIDITKL